MRRFAKVTYFWHRFVVANATSGNALNMTSQMYCQSNHKNIDSTLHQLCCVCFVSMYILKLLHISCAYWTEISIKKRSFIKRQTSVTSSDNEWQRMTTRDNEWYNEWQRMTTSDSEWQRMVQRITTSGATSDKEWQRVIQRVTASDKQIVMSDSEWQQWYNQWKLQSTLQRMNDYRLFNDKNKYTTTSRDGWLQLEWLNK